MKNILKTKKKFKARFICHECYSQIEITDVNFFKAHIKCPFCDNKMWCAYLKDKEYWLPKATEAHLKKFNYEKAIKEESEKEKNE